MKGSIPESTRDMMIQRKGKRKGNLGRKRKVRVVNKPSTGYLKAAGKINTCREYTFPCSHRPMPDNMRLGVVTIAEQLSTRNRGDPRHYVSRCQISKFLCNSIKFREMRWSFSHRWSWSPVKGCQFGISRFGHYHPKFERHAASINTCYM